MLTNTKNLSRLIVLSLILLTSCFGKDEYNVNVFFPNASSNGIISQTLTKFGLKENGNPLSSSDVAKLRDAVSKKFFDGVPVEGKLSIKSDCIEYEPLAVSELSMSGEFGKFKIPYSDIRGVDARRFALVSHATDVRTDYGIFTFQLLRSMPWSDEANEIKEKIEKHL